MYSVFLSSYTNTRESLGELEAFLQNFHSCLYNSIETRYMFSISFNVDRGPFYLTECSLSDMSFINIVMGIVIIIIIYPFTS